jgi:hypothetical protein
MDVMEQVGQKPLTPPTISGILKKLRWGVATRLFRDGQSSIRKENSRLFEGKRKTIAFKAVVFFVILNLTQLVVRE